MIRQLAPGMVQQMQSVCSDPVATAEFSKFAGMLSAALSQHRLSGFDKRQVRWSGIPISLRIFHSLL